MDRWLPLTVSNSNCSFWVSWYSICVYDYFHYKQNISTIVFHLLNWQAFLSIYTLAYNIGIYNVCSVNVHIRIFLAPSLPIWMPHFLFYYYYFVPHKKEINFRLTESVLLWASTYWHVAYTCPVCSVHIQYIYIVQNSVYFSLMWELNGICIWLEWDL